MISPAACRSSGFPVLRMVVSSCETSCWVLPEKRFQILLAVLESVGASTFSPTPTAPPKAAPDLMTFKYSSYVGQRLSSIAVSTVLAPAPITAPSVPRITACSPIRAVLCPTVLPIAAVGAFSTLAPTLVATPPGIVLIKAEATISPTLN